MKLKILMKRPSQQRPETALASHLDSNDTTEKKSTKIGRNVVKTGGGTSSSSSSCDHLLHRRRRKWLTAKNIRSSIISRQQKQGTLLPTNTIIEDQCYNTGNATTRLSLVTRDKDDDIDTYGGGSRGSSGCGSATAANTSTGSDESSFSVGGRTATMTSDRNRSHGKDVIKDNNSNSKNNNKDEEVTEKPEISTDLQEMEERAYNRVMSIIPGNCLHTSAVSSLNGLPRHLGNKNPQDTTSESNDVSTLPDDESQGTEQGKNEMPESTKLKHVDEQTHPIREVNIRVETDEYANYDQDDEEEHYYDSEEEEEDDDNVSVESGHSSYSSEISIDEEYDLTARSSTFLKSLFSFASSSSGDRYDYTDDESTIGYRSDGDAVNYSSRSRSYEEDDDEDGNYDDDDVGEERSKSASDESALDLNESLQCDNTPIRPLGGETTVPGGDIVAPKKIPMYISIDESELDEVETIYGPTLVASA
jgi:hypothetical protein